ncbi:MAG TPA: DUF4476 domain-containing protein, partial [Chitinophagaceae bacterium]|nr:DUF4476 domain-containing protein [Chitinophagaceae bacterium]
MKKLFRLFVFCLIATSSLKAQKVYFVYLQTDNQQPFYARLGEKIYNSTPSGYLILSNLRDSLYGINIGIQGSQAADQPYSIAINRKDQGFLIKNLGEKGWGLFNLSSMAVIMPTSTPASPVQTVKTEKREDNAFTNLLAKAADDSTIKEKPIIEKTVEKKPDAVALSTEKKEGVNNDVKEIVSPKQDDIKKVIVAPVVIKEEPKVDTSITKEQTQESRDAAQMKTDSIEAATNSEAELVKEEALRKQDSIDKAKLEATTVAEYKRSVVKLKSESSTTAGIGLVFYDMLPNDKTDTIRILIPAETTKTSSVELKQDEKKFLDIPPVDSVPPTNAKVSPTKRNNCKIQANTDDFFKLRKKMAGETNDDKMITEAKKVFKTKCFSTSQIKNLATLFLSDEFKYKFFDAAYQYVNDLENFSSLQS